MNTLKSKEKFLEDLRVYLFSSGKKENEIKEIVDELEDHLNEAERNGKSIQHIIGKSPKQYMDSLAKEMSFDWKNIFVYIPIIILGVLAYSIMGRVIQDRLQFTFLELIGYPLICIFFLFVTIIAFKYISSSALSKRKEWIIYSIVGIVPFFCFVGLIFLNRYIETTMFQFPAFATPIALILSVCIFIGIAVWAKSWFTIVIPFILFIPEVIMNQFDVTEEMHVIVSNILPIMLIFIILVIFNVREAKKPAR